MTYIGVYVGKKSVRHSDSKCCNFNALILLSYNKFSNATDLHRANKCKGKIAKSWVAQSMSI